MTHFRLTLLYLLLYPAGYLFGFELKIGIALPFNIQSVEFRSEQFSFVNADSSLFADGIKNQSLKFNFNSNNWNIVSGDSGISKPLLKFARFECSGPTGLHINNLTKPLLTLEDASFEVLLVDSNIRLILNIDLERYLPGVVQAEIGRKKPSEFYALQSVLCRTYALSHLRRHEKEGFHLCNEVHCQVFRGNSGIETAISEAVWKTADLVIVDQSCHLITAAFHGNCGGQTSNSEDAWNKALDYLRSVKDTFCTKSPSYRWEVILEAEQWQKALQRFCPAYRVTEDPLLGNKAERSEVKERNKYYVSGSCKIANRDIREALGLKSTFFTTERTGDKIVIEGHGYGHGVGICQDGAKAMAQKGFTYHEIVHFYYQDVTFADLRQLAFFQFADE